MSLGSAPAGAGRAASVAPGEGRLVAKQVIGTVAFDSLSLPLCSSRCWRVARPCDHRESALCFTPKGDSP